MKNRQLCIAIIEDDYIIAAGLKENLNSLSYSDVFIAHNEIKFLELLDSIDPDLIFVDINLGKDKKTGIDIIKDHNLVDSATVILLSSYSDQEYIDRAKELGVHAYLVKPASMQQLDVSIDLAIANRQKQLNPMSVSPAHPSHCPFIQGKDHFFVKTSGRYEKVFFKDIYYIKAEGAYTQLHTRYCEYLLSFALKQLMSQIQYPGLIKTHRAYVANADFIEAFDEHNVYLKADQRVLEVPISQGYKKDFISLMPRVKGN
jgi:two-component system, LytTR family, response regulator LytT